MNEVEQNAEFSANEVDYTNDMSDFGAVNDGDISLDEFLGMDESNTDDNGMSL